MIQNKKPKINAGVILIIIEILINILASVLLRLIISLVPIVYYYFLKHNINYDNIIVYNQYDLRYLMFKY